ncbi:aspartyl protease family protein [Rhizorhabdus sp. FW153]|uniref:aspartyl protease family protein n=1 Tax=Rhizorhabdus sp. FW153 TaxID=3400216 RepID=UPI003CF4AB48
MSQRLTVPVTIGGSGPYAFVVDTGAERTVLSRELADRLTLAPSASVTLLSIAGEDHVDTAVVPGLSLVSARIRMGRFDAPLLSQQHLGAVGMLGIDSLQTKKVTLDFRAMRMTIADAPRRPQADSDEIVVTARRRLGQLILVDSEIDGQKVNVIIDTGTAVSIGNPALRARLARRGRLMPLVPISITSVTGAQTPADYGSIRTIRLGGVTLNNMPIAFADARIFHRLSLDKRPSLLLGMDALKLFDRVSIDFPNRSVRFVMPGDAFFTPAPRLAALLPGQG